MKFRAIASAVFLLFSLCRARAETATFETFPSFLLNSNVTICNRIPKHWVHRALFEGMSGRLPRTKDMNYIHESYGHELSSDTILRKHTIEYVTELVLYNSSLKDRTPEETEALERILYLNRYLGITRPTSDYPPRKAR